MSVLKEPYKYRLKAAFTQVFGGNTTKALEDLDEKGLIPLGTSRKDINLRMHENGEVPDHRLVIYSELLGLNIDYLKADYLAKLMSDIQKTESV